MNNKEVKSKVCSHKRSSFLDNFVRKIFQSPQRIVGPYIKEGDTVIDLGCGPGFFSLPMVEMVGKTGKVVAVDLQEEMLDIITEKLSQNLLADRIRLHRCSEHDLNLEESLKADFILAYYMVHETPNSSLFFQQIRQHINPEGQLLIVEPPFHVGKKEFKQLVQAAEGAGFIVTERPKRKGGMSVLLTPLENNVDVS